eukprot:Awhi_evm1s15548
MNKLTLFGGLGNGPPPNPNRDTPVNTAVLTLTNYGRPKWKVRSLDSVVEEPWFTSTK